MRVHSKNWKGPHESAFVFDSDYIRLHSNFLIRILNIVHMILTICYGPYHMRCGSFEKVRCGTFAIEVAS